MNSRRSGDPGLQEIWLRRLGSIDAGAQDAPAQFSFGIEEEYFLHDRRTNAVATTTPDRLFREANRATGGRVEREFLQAQAEAVTRPHTSAGEARRELEFIRSVLANLAAEHGLSLLACGTHPTAQWRRSQQTDGERYDRAMDDLQMLGQRDLLCGMHVHVALPDPRRRIEVMYRLMPYLPLFIALSASSPFWTSRDTGLKCYRLAAYDELPRTGLPELFRTTEEYEAYVSALVAAGIIEDSSFIWWMIRPSPKYPTLELRATDCCTRIDDAIAIAALYRALVHHLYRNPTANQDITAVSRALTIENKWRAQRYGLRASFVTEAGSVDVADHLEDVMSMIAEDTRILECERVADCRGIVARGTSADLQLAQFVANTSAGGAAAFDAVIGWIEENTMAGVSGGVTARPPQQPQCR